EPAAVTARGPAAGEAASRGAGEAAPRAAGAAGPPGGFVATVLSPRPPPPPISLYIIHIYDNLAGDEEQWPTLPNRSPQGEVAGRAGQPGRAAGGAERGAGPGGRASGGDRLSGGGPRREGAVTRRSAAVRSGWGAGNAAGVAGPGPGRGGGAPAQEEQPEKRQRDADERGRRALAGRDPPDHADRDRAEPRPHAAGDDRGRAAPGPGHQRAGREPGQERPRGAGQAGRGLAMVVAGPADGDERQHAARIEERGKGRAHAARVAGAAGTSGARLCRTGVAMNHGVPQRGAGFIGIAKIPGGGNARTTTFALHACPLCCGRMPRLLIVHHTASPAMQAMFEAVVAGAGNEEVEGVEVVIRPALTAGAADVLAADGYLLGTPANIGYMSGALKHFFDGIYYPCLEATQRRPYALYVHGASDTGGAVRARHAIP